MKKRIEPYQQGTVFERLTVVEYLGTRQRDGPKYRYKQHMYKCACMCGTTKEVDHWSMAKGYTKSCGCLKNEKAAYRMKVTNTTHGMSKDDRYAMWSGARRRARTRGIEFDIELEDVCIPEVCPVLGISLVPSVGSPKDNSPSLDRIDPSKGYIKGNVAVVSYRLNRLKNSFTPEELLAVLIYTGKETFKIND